MQNLKLKHLYLLAGSCLVLGVIFDLLFYNRLVGLSLFIYTALLLGVLFAGLHFGQKSYNRQAAWLVLPILFFAAWPSWRASEFLLFWNLVLTAVLLLFLAVSLVMKPLHQFVILDYGRTIIFWPARFISQSFRALGQLVSSGWRLSGEKMSHQVFRGLVIALPILAFFIFLFSQADLVFKRGIEAVFSFDQHLSPDFSAQVIIAVLVGFIWLGVYSYIFEQVSDNRTSSPLAAPAQAAKLLGNIEANIVYSSLNVLFLAFVLIQFRYLFAGHEAVAKLGYSYADYAHRGFGELVVAALAAFVIIFWSERLVQTSYNRLSLILRGQTSLLALLVLVIMVSAFMRLSVYEQAYGFTELRLLVQAVIIWLGLVSGWLVYRVWRPTSDARFAWGIFLSVIAFFAALNIFASQDFIARRNIQYFAARGELDVRYLANLSADAVPALIQLLDRPDWVAKDGQSLPPAVAVILLDYQKEMGADTWPAYNRSRQRARRLIGGRQEKIERLAAQATPPEAASGLEAR